MHAPFIYAKVLSKARANARSPAAEGSGGVHVPKGGIEVRRRESRQSPIAAGSGGVHVPAGGIKVKDGHGGEGSRGGKIIGHTSSGKPIYQNSDAAGPHYRAFSGKDHREASVLHRQKADEHESLASTMKPGVGRDNHEVLASRHSQLSKFHAKEV